MFQQAEIQWLGSEEKQNFEKQQFKQLNSNNEDRMDREIDAAACDSTDY